MSKKNIVFKLLFFYLFIFSCSSDEEIKIDPNDKTNNIQENKLPLFPEVTTLEATIGPNKGVNLSGEINPNNNDIIEVGFEYSLDSQFKIKTTLKSQTNSKNEIKYFIATGLKENVKYYYRAFVKNKSKYFYGKTLNFISDGSVIPIIESISKRNGCFGDTLKISGKHFKDTHYKTKINFSNINSEILTLKDTIVECIVPNSLNKIISDVSVKINNREDTYSSFQLLPPEITSIIPLNASFRDEITILGNNFDFDISKNKVFFGNIEATVTYASKTKLKVLVPDNLENSSEIIKVKSQLQEVIFEEKFKLLPPKINFVPNNGFLTNELFEIIGENFHPVSEKNKIFVNEFEVTPSSGDNKSLMIKAPLGPFPRRKANIKIQILDIIVEFDLELEVLNKWVMISDNLTLRYNGSMNNAVTANNKVYLITGQREGFDTTLYLWTFNKEDFSWTQTSIPFTVGGAGIVETDGIDIYVYQPYFKENFWKFDTTLSTWSLKKNFIGADRSGATHFSINGEIYIGSGVDFNNNTNYADFYKYDPNTDSWEQISNLPLENRFDKRTNTGAFVIKEIGYVTGGAFDTGDVECWAYDPTTDLWNQIKDFPDPRRSTSAFSLNGLGYVTGGGPISGSNSNDCWVYDPSSNNWDKIENIGPFGRGRHFSFTLDGKAYVGGGLNFSGGSTQFNLYEFIP